MIHFARTAPLDKKLDKKSISKLIYNFEIRTRNLRQNLRESLNIVIQEVSGNLADPIRYEKLLKQMVSDEINKLIDDQCENRGVPRSMLPLFRVSLRSELKGEIEKLIPNIYEEMKKFCQPFKELMVSTLENNVKKAHISAMLKSSKQASPKLKWYEQLEYSIYESQNEEIPLGDSIILFHVNDEREFRTFLDNKKSLVAVILPISPTRIIYGTKNRNYSPNFSSLKQAIVSTSKEFFLFKTFDSDFDSLKIRISTNSYILSEEEIKKIVLN